MTTILLLYDGGHLEYSGGHLDLSDGLGVFNDFDDVDVEYGLFQPYNSPRHHFSVLGSGLTLAAIWSIMAAIVI